MCPRRLAPLFVVMQFNYSPYLGRRRDYVPKELLAKDGRAGGDPQGSPCPGVYHGHHSGVSPVGPAQGVSQAVRDSGPQPGDYGRRWGRGGEGGVRPPHWVWCKDQECLGRDFLVFSRGWAEVLQ